MVLPTYIFQYRTVLATKEWTTNGEVSEGHGIGEG